MKFNQQKKVNNMRFFYILMVFLSLISGCYGVNERTSEIGTLTSTCLDDSVYAILEEKYSTKNILDPEFLSALEKMKTPQSLSTVFLYFDTLPREIIAIDESYYFVRYVYNPELYPYPVSGLPDVLSNKERKRIVNRVQGLLMEYECDKGKEESLRIMKSEQLGINPQP